MPVKQEIEVIISPEGEVKIEVRGMHGPGCVPEVERVAQALGEVKSHERKPEYYLKPGDARTKVEEKRGG